MNVCVYIYIVYIHMHVYQHIIYIYLHLNNTITNLVYIHAPIWALCLKVNPPKEGVVQSKRSSFGFQVCIFITASLHKIVVSFTSIDIFSKKLLTNATRHPTEFNYMAQNQNNQISQLLCLHWFYQLPKKAAGIPIAWHGRKEGHYSCHGHNQQSLPPQVPCS